MKCLHEAISLYGQDLRHEQVVGEDLADLIIGYYAASSAINRLLQLGDETPRATRLTGLWRGWSRRPTSRRPGGSIYRLRPVLFSDNYAQRLARDVGRADARSFICRSTP